VKQCENKQLTMMYIHITQRNLHRVWDVAYDGYCGGKGMTLMPWSDVGVDDFIQKSSEMTSNYAGVSIVCVPIITTEPFKSPLPLCSQGLAVPQLGTGDLLIQDVNAFMNNQVKCIATRNKLSHVFSKLEMHQDFQMVKDACQAVGVGETTQCRLLYKGTSTFSYTVPAGGAGGVGGVVGATTHVPTYGCGHHGHDYVGVASVRNGKSLMAVTAPTINMARSSPLVPA